MEFRFKAGRLPMLVSMPHAGTDIPDEVAHTLAPCAAARADTDWHLPELYGFLEEMGISNISARWSRYLSDLNRPPEDTNLYPGLDTTGLCPLDTFGRERLYRDGMEPDGAEVQQRLARYRQPYHAQLREQVAPYDADRFVAPDIEAARTMVGQGAVSASCKTLFTALHP